ncbi:CpsD/CapB family tyrosine-protein kinase [Neobacillus jeddahensis]|uniref:CpsD/CapB family tyrosine-protein kinase n=1 Tax=Neobacillus jeddahensis TaxID=1461580 RepID=UPI0005911339
MRLPRTLKSKRAVINLIAHNNSKSPITEKYRLIRNNLQFSSIDKDIKSIVVTSPEPSDGKSTTSANLAIVLAQQGKKVLLVDADLRKPSVHYAFNLSNTEGLTSVLTKKISLKQAIQITSIPNLAILTSGQIPPNPYQLLDSEAMQVLIKVLNTGFEYVIYDTPPILAATDSQIIANKCDGVILVVASGKTRKEVALKSKVVLENANAQLLGVVVNGVDSNNETYYQYG